MDNNKQDNPKTILVIVTGLLVLRFIFKSDYFLFASLGIGLISLIIPVVGDGIVWLWFKIAQVLGWINTRILLSVVFFTFVTPIALLSRVFKKNMLQLRDKDAKTVFVTRNHTYKKEDLEETW
jgi:hypothetical protein